MYSLNAQSAREADSSGAYLDKSGKYIGRFTRAEKLVSKKGNHGIGFTFQSESKQTTKFNLWLINVDQVELPAIKTLNAILVCLRLKDIQPAKGKVERYDYDSKTNSVVDAEVFPDLMNKSIGLVLRNTEYLKMQDGVYTGHSGWKLELVVPFDAESELTASEILDRKTKPEKLEGIVSRLEDKPLKTQLPTASKVLTTHPPKSAPFDDDIPF